MTWNRADSSDAIFATPWHQRSRFIASLRGRLRTAFFGFVRGTFATDEGRSIATAALQGLLASRPELGPLEELESGRLPYPGLGRPRARVATLGAGRPVFITARFRTGSTLLWRIFRSIDGVTAYYEPLNERRWFDRRTRGSQIDPSHRGVSDYWKEYEGLDSLGDHYREAWIGRNLYMGASFWDPAMSRYIATLIEKAPRQPVLQFNRVDFRLAWLRRNFPSALIVHLYRHPREQWCSSLGDPTLFTKEGTLAEFAAHDRFYLRLWAADLKYQFPFLDETTVAHPYQLFYYLWRLSYLFGRLHADHSLSFEDLVAEPRTELGKLLRATEIRVSDLDPLVDLIDSPRLGGWSDYADENWFVEHETVCEETIAEFLGPSGSWPAASSTPRPRLWQHLA